MRVTDTERAMLKQNYEADRIARMLQFKVPFFMRIVATALIMAGLVFVVSVFKLPNPNMILISGLVICSALFGVPGGIVSAVAMLSYTFYFFSDNHDFVTFTPENMQKVLVTFVGVTIVGVFVCALKNAQSRALEDAYTLADLLKEDNELLEQASSIDTLTGLKNRFSLRRDYSRYVEEGKSLHVMMVDLDDFKKINDTGGHHRGDEALTDVGRVLIDVFGQSHTYRYGGDEFLVIVSEWTDTVFKAAVESMRAQLGELTVGETGEPVLFSGGYVSGTPLYQPDLRFMIRQADDNLYQAKQSGKNQVCGTPYDRSVAENLEVDNRAVRFGDRA